MRIILNIIRIFVGVLFIFSGLIKANDPLGLSYKMQEFFEVWGWHSLNPYTLSLSVIMIAFEIIAGVAVIIGWRMRLFSWLLLLLIVFFTFLTGYALFSGKIKECGCFGDCIPLQANQSFIKDLVLLVLILVIFYYRNKIRPFTSTPTSLIILFFTAIFSFALQWYVLLHLPIIDCLPYKKGNHIPEKMKAPPGSVPDSTAITFVYQYQGKEIEFGSDNFPENFDDSAYTFIRRYDKLIRKGNAIPAISDFSLNTLSGNDTTLTLLAEDRYQLYFLIKDGVRLGNWVNMMSLVQQSSLEKNIPMFMVTNLPAHMVEELPVDIEDMTILRSDGTAIKTFARANPALVLIRNGVILEKWSYADFENVVKKLNGLQKQ